MLAKRAVELKVRACHRLPQLMRQASSYSVVPVDESLRNLKLGLAGAHQRSNASLALGLVRAFLASERTPQVFRAAGVDLSPSAPLDDRLRRGLETVRWAGRCQIAVDPAPERRSVTYYLDGAHTVESLAECGKWFMAERSGSATGGSRPTRVLIFNCTFDRTPEELLGALVAAAGDLQIDQAIFCTNTTYRDGSKGGTSAHHSVAADSQTSPRSCTIRPTSRPLRRRTRWLRSGARCIQTRRRASCHRSRMPSRSSNRCPRTASDPSTCSSPDRCISSAASCRSPSCRPTRSG